MKLLKQFHRDEKGASEAIGFLATILLLMLVILNLYSPIKYVFQTFVVENVHRVTLLEMEQEGGFTPDIETKAIERLKNLGMDEARINIYSSTPKPVQWGQTLDLTIEYVNEYTQYSFASFALGSTTEEQSIRVSRSSVSREYFK